MKRNLTAITVFIVLILACTNKKSPNQSQDYFKNLPSLDRAKLFAPGIISKNFNVRDFAISNDGKTFLYSVKGVGYFSIIQVKKTNEIWQSPEVASFSGKYSDLEPCFSPDGKRLYFVSNRPIDENKQPKDFDIWYVEVTQNGFGQPQNLGAPINTTANEFYPSFTDDGSLFFCANYNNGFGGEDLYYSKFINGRFQKPINLGDSVNTNRDEFNAFVSRKGDYIIFGSTGWGNGLGGGDMWISFNIDDAWRKPINMGDKINSKFFEYCPYVTPDEKYLFFTSNRHSIEPFAETGKSFEQISKEVAGIENGSQNIYWISSEIISQLRTNFMKGLK